MEELLQFLKEHHIEYVLHEHEPIFTTEQSDRLHGIVPGAHSKNLFLKDKKGAFFLISVMDHKRVNLKTLSKVYGKGGLSFASAEELMSKLKLTPGSVTPYALMYDKSKEITFLLDQEFLKYENVNFHPMQNDFTINVGIKGFLRFFERIGCEVRVMEIPILD